MGIHGSPGHPAGDDHPIDRTQQATRTSMEATENGDGSKGVAKNWMIKAKIINLR